MDIKLILSSCSPRRRELIKFLGFPFECICAETDESVNINDPEEAVTEISIRKAGAAFAIINSDRNGLKPGEILIGADTVVSVDGRILGKPYDDNDAANMLRMLSGRTHSVFTGVTLMYVKKDENGLITTQSESFAEKTEVHVAKISEADIKKYINSGEHADKAGSYAIQGAFSIHITGICGDYNNVVGFPVAKIYKKIKNIYI